VTLVSRAALVLFVGGAVGDVLGAVALATLLLVGTTQAVLAAVALALAALILRSLVQVALLTEAARRVGLAPAHSDTVRTTTFRAIDALAVFAWGASALRAFFLLEPLLGALRRGLEWKMPIGAFSFEPSDLVIFALVIWASFKLAALIEFVLNLDLLPHVDLPRGVPEAIAHLSRYTLICLGAVVASVAAGLDIGRVTIILGALGVGIGFGLQNIVNNFVSGLILLFERPIRIGDTLEMGGTGGVVQRIGMRASVVRTWDEAEIIVPNARLVSEDVINWTLSHDRRRIVIPFGVAYGNDPERVVDLIAEVARASEDVHERPEPMCLFSGFGDSSLDFKLYAWTTTWRFLRVASDLRIAIAHRLKEAGIEVPFPQRDLHLRSVDPGLTLATARSREPGAPESS
jgi:small-conductance mechanosensitive channel